MRYSPPRRTTTVWIDLSVRSVVGRKEQYRQEGWVRSGEISEYDVNTTHWSVLFWPWPFINCNLFLYWHAGPLSKIAAILNDKVKREVSEPSSGGVRGVNTLVLYRQLRLLCPSEHDEIWQDLDFDLDPEVLSLKYAILAPCEIHLEACPETSSGYQPQSSS